MFDWNISLTLPVPGADCPRTGFPGLDAVQILSPVLYALAGACGAGKTTLAHQMAEQIAAAGGDALFFSLEQSKAALDVKSLARRIFLDARNRTGPGILAEAVREFASKTGRKPVVVVDSVAAVSIGTDAAAAFKYAVQRLKLIQAELDLIV